MNRGYKSASWNDTLDKSNDVIYNSADALKNDSN